MVVEGSAFVEVPVEEDNVYVGVAPVEEDNNSESHQNGPEVVRILGDSCNEAEDEDMHSGAEDEGDSNPTTAEAVELPELYLFFVHESLFGSQL